MWAITSYYNPAGYKRRLTNYRIFHKGLSIPLVTVELSFDGNFELTENDADILIQISGGAVVWQKERLLNLAIKSVPSNVNSIAWLDCDIIFDNPDWTVEAKTQLNIHNVVQLYSTLVDLDRTSRLSDCNYRSAPESAHGIVSLVNENKLKHADVAPLLAKGRAAGGQSMGLAWAARREILEGHGLYDAMIIGSGDRVLVGTIYGQFQKIVEVFELNGSRQEHYLKWARRYYEAVGDRVGCVSGRVYHLWHGEFANRKALERHRLLARLDFQPDVDLTIGLNGAWQWARSRPDLKEFFANYFASRAEDG